MTFPPIVTTFPHFIASFQVVFSHHVGNFPITWLPYVAMTFRNIFSHFSHPFLSFTKAGKKLSSEF